MTRTESLFGKTINDFCNKICRNRTHAVQQRPLAAIAQAGSNAVNGEMDSLHDPLIGYAGAKAAENRLAQRRIRHQLGVAGGNGAIALG